MPIFEDEDGNAVPAGKVGKGIVDSVKAIGAMGMAQLRGDQREAGEILNQHQLTHGIKKAGKIIQGREGYPMVKPADPKNYRR